jgi:hypothetical protein
MGIKKILFLVLLGVLGSHTLKAVDTGNYTRLGLEIESAITSKDFQKIGSLYNHKLYVEKFKAKNSKLFFIDDVGLLKGMHSFFLMSMVHPLLDDKKLTSFVHNLLKTIILEGYFIDVKYKQFKFLRHRKIGTENILIFRLIDRNGFYNYIESLLQKS